MEKRSEKSEKCSEYKKSLNKCLKYDKSGYIVKKRQSTDFIKAFIKLNGEDWTKRKFHNIILNNKTVEFNNFLLKLLKNL